MMKASYGSFLASMAIRRATRAWAALRIPVSPETAMRALELVLDIGDGAEGRRGDR